MGKEHLRNVIKKGYKGERAVTAGTLLSRKRDLKRLGSTSLLKRAYVGGGGAWECRSNSSSIRGRMN